MKQDDLDIFNTDKVNRRRDPNEGEVMSVISGRQNSHWAGLTGLPGMGVPMGGPKHVPGDLMMKSNAVKEAMLQNKIA